MKLYDNVKVEKITLQAMVKIYCNHKHQNKSGLCNECNELLKYSETRLNKCKYGSKKPVCKKCSTHCYNPENRDAIKKVMRFSGPKMILKHPVLTIIHLIK